MWMSSNVRTLLVTRDEHNQLSVNEVDLVVETGGIVEADKVRNNTTRSFICFLSHACRAWASHESQTELLGPCFQPPKREMRPTRISSHADHSRRRSLGTTCWASKTEVVAVGWNWDNWCSNIGCHRRRRCICLAETDAAAAARCGYLFPKLDGVPFSPCASRNISSSFLQSMHICNVRWLMMSPLI